MKEMGFSNEEYTNMLSNTKWSTLKLYISATLYRVGNI